jgi:DNA (cytosine-5)-methyltransferase 1
MKPATSYISVTDQFCGASAAGATVVMALNHWKLAVETHNTNFPDTDHDCTDISACDPRRYPSTDILITSPECTNHSLAKGKSRKNQQYDRDLFGNKLADPTEERSRATMWDVPRFAEYHNYNIIIVENVVDARNWVLFPSWLHAMHALGYRHQIVYFNSQFAHPTPQSRDRMYVVFWRKGNKKPNLNFTPDAYCPRCEKQVSAVQAWKKPSTPWGRYGAKRQYIYVCPTCAKEVRPSYYPAWTAIDWSLPVERIGDRKKPLRPRTLERIKYGLEKFGRMPTVVETAYMQDDKRAPRPVDGSMPTQTGRQTLALSIPLIMSYYSRNDATAPSTVPFGTVVSENRFAMIVPPFLMPNQSADRVARSVDEPFFTQTASGQQWFIVPPFIAELYNTSKARGTDEPFSTVVAGGNHHALVFPPFFTSLNHSDDRVRSTEQAAPTVMPQGNPGLVVPPFLVEYYNTGNARDLEQPFGTVVTHDRNGLVMPDGELCVEDCGFRMIQPHEIQRVMAFPSDYVVLGSSRDKVRQLGNALTPPVMKMIMERCVATLE